MCAPNAANSGLLCKLGLCKLGYAKICYPTPHPCDTSRIISRNPEGGSSNGIEFVCISLGGVDPFVVERLERVCFSVP